MPKYGIKLMRAGWNNDNVVGFSKGGATRFGGDMEPGTRMLLYETMSKPKGSKAKGTKSLVGEVEVTGDWDAGEKLRAPEEDHAKLIPVKVIRARGDQPLIPLERIREIIADEAWPRMGEAWKPLTDEQYQTFLKEWGVAE